jgi:RecJ-like exonuclease
MRKNDGSIVCDKCRGTGKRNNGQPCGACGGKGGWQTVLDDDGPPNVVLIKSHEGSGSY